MHTAAGNLQVRLAILGWLALLPLAVHAHEVTGVGFGLVAGFAHPLGGIDHVLAMVAVGLWAAQLGRPAFWLVPAGFVFSVAVGGLIGTLATAVPWVEQVIVLSVLALGMVVAAGARIPLVGALLLVAFFGLFHGHAHTTEMPADVSGLSYGLGFLLASLVLNVVGMSAGLIIQRVGRNLFMRIIGSAIALYGALLAA